MRRGASARGQLLCGTREMPVEDTVLDLCICRKGVTKIVTRGKGTGSYFANSQFLTSSFAVGGRMGK